MINVADDPYCNDCGRALCPHRVCRLCGDCADCNLEDADANAQDELAESAAGQPLNDPIDGFPLDCWVCEEHVAVTTYERRPICGACLEHFLEAYPGHTTAAQEEGGAA